MFSFESFNVFKKIYYTEHLRTTASVFFFFFWNFGWKGFLNDSSVFQKEWLQT